jgi:hypothetical protein
MILRSTSNHGLGPHYGLAAPPGDGRLAAQGLGVYVIYTLTSAICTHHHFTSSPMHDQAKYTRYHSGRRLPPLVRTQLLQSTLDPNVSQHLLTS